MEEKDKSLNHYSLLLSLSLFAFVVGFASIQPSIQLLDIGFVLSTVNLLYVCINPNRYKAHLISI